MQYENMESEKVVESLRLYSACAFTKQRIDRWLYLANKPKKFASAIRDAWNHLEFDSHEDFNFQDKKYENMKWRCISGREDEVLVASTVELQEDIFGDVVCISTDNKYGVFISHHDDPIVIEIRV